VSRDERTYGTVREKYDSWVEAERVRTPRDYLRRTDSDSHSPHARGDSDMSRLVFAAIGFGIGIILLALSGYALYTASYWGSFGRDGAQVGYTMVAVFLLIAGAGGIAATYNHNFRVLVRPPSHH
jgi:hypothetical protein